MGTRTDTSSKGRKPERKPRRKRGPGDVTAATAARSLGPEEQRDEYKGTAWLPEQTQFWDAGEAGHSRTQEKPNSLAFPTFFWARPWKMKLSQLLLVNVLHGQLRASPPFLSNPGSQCPPLLWSLCSHTNEGHCLFPNLPRPLQLPSSPPPPEAGIPSNSPQLVSG